jgi:N12 class adenine-specific DNA methylase
MLPDRLTCSEGARDKQEKIKERFKAWIWQDDERRERLVRHDNDEFNNVRLRTFSGEHLTLPGASPAITLRPHQKAAVWRILQTPNCLLAHVVGAGIMPIAA